MNHVHLVVPAGVDDPARVSGGNVYDRHIRDGLREVGWQVTVHEVAGTWAEPDDAAAAALGRRLAAIPDGELVVVDGLLATATPAVVVPEAARIGLVVLLHMPIGGEGEAALLRAARAVIATSDWTRRTVIEWHAVPTRHVRVAEPGTDAAPLARGTSDGGELLCVAAVVPAKGHDLLAAALAELVNRDWHCRWAGSLDRDPEWVRARRRQLAASGLADRVTLSGAVTRARLADVYSCADLLVLPSRGETFGMVVTEALARGLPVIATAVGGVPEALGRAPDGTRPGLLVDPDDPGALAIAMATWLDDGALRARLRDAAIGRRTSLAGWAETTRIVAETLRDVTRH